MIEAGFCRSDPPRDKNRREQLIRVSVTASFPLLDFPLF